MKKRDLFAMSNIKMGVKLNGKLVYGLMQTYLKDNAILVHYGGATVPQTLPWSANLAIRMASSLAIASSLALSGSTSSMAWKLPSPTWPMMGAERRGREGERESEGEGRERERDGE